jgi:hypothetical protein
MTFLAYFLVEKPMDSVHGLWTTGTVVHDRPTSITDRWSSLAPDLRLLWSSRPMAKVQGGGVEHGGPNGPLIGGQAMVRGGGG